ncbi:PLP-dependent aminotransferase family protein [Pseudomonas sp. HR96]|uniref:MocR-like pyridoxine biosynthesis transcription factor PdxR n=1 Tax=Pseudomonas sp. HR96 TaxID=1027966 RepID=UPI002A7538BC|nr:PLP-dependent aminotransferase family protein [Pseudomonas sp. HR96]WPO99984.1 PLP-dependent aminotransferase family protein [Pseudomonas sp. HR96]
MPTPSNLGFDPSGILLDRRLGLSQQLYQQLRTRMLAGQIGRGTRLPASRDLAQVLGISRNSVVRAYEQLYAEGFIHSRVGAGTFVDLPENLSTKLSTGFATPLSTRLSTNRAETTGDTVSPVWTNSALDRLKNNHLPLPRSGPPKAFRVGIHAFDLFPFDIWSKLQAAFWRKPDLGQLGYGEAEGDPRLRELIAAYLRSSRGLSCSAEQIVITTGAQQAIGLCAQLLLEPGDSVAVENPGYRAAGHAFANAGARLRGVAVDNDGLVCSELEQITDCRIAYVTPAHQYPTGVTMSLARRLQLLAWAQRCQGWVIEDDYDGEYRYNGAPLAPLAALDRQGRVIYVGTFGKVAFPALRLGYLVLPQPLVEPFRRRRAVAVRSSEVGTQAVMAEFIAQGHFQRHIRRMRRAALSRRDALLEHWPMDIPGCAAMPRVDAGLHVKIDVDSHVREAQLVQLAAEVDVELNPLSDYWLAATPSAPAPGSGLVLGFAAVDERAIEQAAKRLQRAWQSGL